MEYSETQVMLTLAALSYRGFQDVFTANIHEEFVRDALTDGLHTFPSVRSNWELVWGPATSRNVPLPKMAGLAAFDRNAMYVVRNRRLRNKYVIAIRGTNPVSAEDWLFGDFWVSSTVKWPYSSGDERISTSTAIGLASIQQLRSGLPSTTGKIVHLVAKETRQAVHAMVRIGSRILKGIPRLPRPEEPAYVEQQFARIVNHWVDSLAERDAVKKRLQEIDADLLIASHELRPKLPKGDQTTSDLDLLSFLKSQADEDPNSALEVIVTGHSKGGALAPTVALWLAEALQSDSDECWDTNRKANVHCYAFAGPTAGNGSFATRLDAIIGDRSHFLVNSNDLAPNAFQTTDLLRIPQLYGSQTEVLGPLVQSVIARIGHLDYRHSEIGVTHFAGKLDSNRVLPAEIAHQHLDAYLAYLDLLSDEVNAFTCFV